MPAPKGNQNALGNVGGAGPTAYESRYAAMAETACQAGFTDRQLADLFGVCPRTIANWKVEHVEFLAALRAGKDVADEHVERSLYARAVGFECDEIDIRVVNGEIVQTTVRRCYPPDTGAAIFWLKNRRRQQWRDKTELDANVNVLNRPLGHLSDAEIALELAQLEAGRKTHA